VQLAAGVVREIADALRVDWRNGSKESQEMANTACWYLFVPRKTRGEKE
jgi:hypothetical protein